MNATKTEKLEYCTVIRIGQFAGGSFGVSGNPSLQHDMYRVDCPELREIEAASAPGMPDYSAWTFLTEWEAHRKAVQQDYRESQRTAARIKADRLAADRRAIGANIRDTLKEAGVDTTSAIRWTDQLTDDALLAPASRAAIDRLGSGSVRDYEARTEVDGVVYRVRLGRGIGCSPRVARLELASR